MPYNVKGKNELQYSPLASKHGPSIPQASSLWLKSVKLSAFEKTTMQDESLI
jgi:hypothetical protein